jgi:hypothetical protein
VVVLAFAVAIAMVGFGFGGAPASALNHDSYNILRNTGSHQYCVDIRTEDPPVSARAHLWTCTRPVVAEQQFLLVTDSFGHDQIKVQRSGYCIRHFDDGPVRQQRCVPGLRSQSWLLRDTGEIVSFLTGGCLTADDRKDADVLVRPCDGTISQRWFF